MPDINIEKACFIVVKARAFDAKVEVDDPDSGSNPADDRAIDAHCLRLMSERAILVGAYIDGTQRAGIEIIPDRSAQRAQAVVTAEQGFQSHALIQSLITRAAEEARKHHFSEIHFRGVEVMPGHYDPQIARSA